MEECGTSSVPHSFDGGSDAACEMRTIRMIGAASPRLFAGGVMDVENFYRVIRYPIEDLVRISDQRNYAYARSIGDFLRTLRPSRDTLKDGVEPVCEWLGNRRVVIGDIVQDDIEIGERLGGKDDLHFGMDF